MERSDIRVEVDAPTALEPVPCQSAMCRDGVAQGGFKNQNAASRHRSRASTVDRLN
jgi:hypothetical protein